MSTTRTLTLTFVGASSQELPGGRFLFIKSATASLDIVLTDDNGTQSIIQSIGAGARQRRLNSDAWRFTRITSSAAQVVTVVLSDDAEFDVANTVSVSGSVTVVDVPATALADTVDTTQASATETTIALNAARRSIIIGVLSTSGNGVRVSQAGGGNTRGVEIQPGTNERFEYIGALVVRNANLAGNASAANWYAEEFT